MNMARTPSVIPFAKPRSDSAPPPASNVRSRTCIFQIGDSRFAIDVYSRIRSLPPEPEPSTQRGSVIPIQTAPDREASAMAEQAPAVVSLASVPEQSDSCGAPGSTEAQQREDNHMESAFFITADGKLGNTQDAEPPSGSATFHTEEQLAELARHWPTSRLVRVWNGLAGVLRVQRFENRAVAVRRLWRALQPEAPQENRPARKRARQKRPALPRDASKAAQVLRLLARPQGATVQDIMAATGWQAHSVRGFISGNLVKRRKLNVRSLKLDGVRVYRVQLGSGQVAVSD